MTIADDLLASENFAVILHDRPLLFQGVRFEFAGSISGVVCGCESGIAGRLQPAKGIAAKIRLLPAFGASAHRRCSLPKMVRTASCSATCLRERPLRPIHRQIKIMLGHTLAGAPAILKHRLSAVKIREIKIRIGRNGFPN